MQFKWRILSKITPSVFQMIHAINLVDSGRDDANFAQTYSAIVSNLYSQYLYFYSILQAISYLSGFLDCF